MPFRRYRIPRLITAAVVGCTTVVVAATAASASIAVKPTTFGVHFLHTDQLSWPTTSSGTLRVWDDGASWRELQPAAPTTTNGGGWSQTALHHLDGLVNGAASRHIQVILVLGQTPRWASAAPNDTGGSDSRHRFIYGAGAGLPPRGAVAGAWDNYVRFLARRYGSKITAYETWNEANFPTFWQGSMGSIVGLTRRTLGVLRALGSRAVVLAPSLGARNANAAPWLRGYLAAGGGHYAAAYAVHMYPNTGYLPETMAGQIAAIRGSLAAFGQSAKPVWDTEVSVGYRPAGVYYSGYTAGALLARVYFLEPNWGISRTVWYAWGDGSWSGVWLNDAGGGISTAGQVERRVYSWLVGSSSAGCAQNGQVWRCSFRYSNGTVGTAFWSTGSAGTVTAPAGSYRLLRIDGSVGAVHGGQRLRVTGVPVFVKW